MRIRSVFAVAALAFFSRAFFAAAADCPACAKLFDSLAAVQAEKKSASELLAKNEEALSKISADDISKKVKLASNIFLLKTKIETKANNGVVLEKQITDMRCNTCPKPKPPETK
ncbi:MAG: hypothetical protein HYW49_08845 [Deltaproteobacteria bacterium]|nr:hypothetical protein [Deltaproteobacteria bacterium]